MSTYDVIRNNVGNAFLDRDIVASVHFPEATPSYSLLRKINSNTFLNYTISSSERDTLVKAVLKLKTQAAISMILETTQSRVFNFNGAFKISSTGFSDSFTKQVRSSVDNKEYNIDITSQLKIGTASVNFQMSLEGDLKVVPVLGYSSGSREGSLYFNAASGNNSVVLTFNHSDPVINNLTVVGNFWENPITVNWRGDFQEGYEYELYYNNSLLKTGSGSTEQNFVIPPKTFTGKLPASVRVRTYNTRPDNTRIFSNWSESSVSLKDIEATISSLLVEGDLWENDILVSWRSEEQEQFRLEVLQSNVVIKTYTGTTDKQFILPANTLIKGQYVFKVTVAYDNRFINSNEKGVSLKDILPKVSGLTISGSNIDLNLILRWASENQQKYEIAAFKDSTVAVVTASGTTDTMYTFANNTLTTGQHTFKVRVGYKDRFSEWISLSSVLVETVPSIGVLEPDGIIIDKNARNKIWWTSNNQSKFKLTIDSQTPITGTNAKEYYIEAGELAVGRHTVYLEVIYVTPLGLEKSSSKKALFIIQGKPPTPTFTSPNTFAVSRPVITWDTQDQQGYILNLIKGGDAIWSTGWINGLITRQKILDFMHDGKYSVAIKIINEFSIESDWSYMDIEIATSVSESIELIVKKHTLYAELEWNNKNTKFDFFYVVRDGLPIAKVLNDVVYNDYTAIYNSDYQILGVTQEDIGKYSNKESVNVSINGSYMATIDRLDDYISVGQNYGNFVVDVSVNYEHNIIQCAGREFGISVFGEHRADAINLSFVSLEQANRFLIMCDRKKPFCYRDRLSKVFIVVNNPKFKRAGLTLDYVITGQRIDYNEVIKYD